MVETDEFLRVLKQADHILAAYVPEVFTEANQMLAAMSPSQVSGIRGVWLRLTNGEYKAACKRAIGLRRGAKASGTVIFRELTKAKETQEKWQEWSGSELDAKKRPGDGGLRRNLSDSPDGAMRPRDDLQIELGCLGTF